MCQEVWKSSPNVISHIEAEADKHLLEDKTRKEKIEQLKVCVTFWDQTSVEKIITSNILFFILFIFWLPNI